MEFELKIDLDNDDFQDDTETSVRAMLKQVSEQLAKGFTEGKIFDTNGNKVGNYGMKDKS